MKLKMIHTHYGSPDGVQVEEYKKDETYNVRDSLASIFLIEGWAVKADKTPRRMKDQGSAPENKSIKSKAKRKTKRAGGGHGA